MNYEINLIFINKKKLKKIKFLNNYEIKIN